MSKKGLIASLIIGLVTTLSLGIYTIVSVVGGRLPAGPVNTNQTVAFRTNDIVEIFEGYSEEDKTLEFINLEEGATNPITYNAETKVYTASAAGKVGAVVTLDEKGNTITYDITVYAQGDGLSAESPYILASKKHVEELRDAMRDTDTYVCPAYLEFVSDIYLNEDGASEKTSWLPIGTGKNPYHVGTPGQEDFVIAQVKGNGYTIHNLYINVTEDNYTDYLCIRNSQRKQSMHLGFFGNISSTVVSDLGFNNAEIIVDEKVYEIFAADELLQDISVGVVAGVAFNSDIVGDAENKTNLTANINAFSYGGSYSNGLGGVIGNANISSVENYVVNVAITNNMKAEESIIGGIVGNFTTTKGAYEQSQKNSIVGCEVTFDADVHYANKSVVGGLVGQAVDITIENSHVKEFKIDDILSNNEEIDLSLKDVTVVAGAVGHISYVEINDAELAPHFVNTINNVTVSGLKVSFRGGNAYGFVVSLGSETGSVTTTVTNSAVLGGNLTASTAAGFAETINYTAEVKYTADYTGVAVKDVIIKSTRPLGFAKNIYGKVESLAEAKTVISSTLKGLGDVYEAGVNQNEAREYTYSAGVVAYLESVDNTYKASVSGFDVQVNASQSLNYSGVAHQIKDAEVRNTKVNATFVSSNSKVVDKNTNFSATYRVAGVVATAFEGTVVNNVDVILTVNQVEDKSLSYGAAFFGGVAARIVEDGVTIRDCEVSGNVYFNFAHYTVSDVEASVTHKTSIFAAGGLVGAISSTTSIGGEVDGFSAIDLASTVITANTVNELTLIADIKDFVANENQLSPAPTMSTSKFYRVKALGILVGTINNTNEFSLNGNTVGTVDFKARTSSFTITYMVEDVNMTLITYGVNKTKVYGASFNTVTAEDVVIKENSYNEIV